MLVCLSEIILCCLVNVGEEDFSCIVHIHHEMLRAPAVSI
jgi:hypothetical protein